MRRISTVVRNLGSAARMLVARSGQPRALDLGPAPDRLVEALERRLVLDAGPIREAGGGPIDPDLELNATAAGGSFQPGGIITVASLNVVNTGNTDAGRFRIAAFLSLDNARSANDIALTPSINRVNGLDAQSSFSETNLGLVVPANAPAGNYFLIIVADADDQVVEADPSNNTFVSGTAAFTIAGAVIPRADLTGTASIAPGTYARGQVINGSFTIRNNGTAQAAASAAVVVLSPDNLFGNGNDFEVLVSPVDPINAGGALSDGGEIIIPANIPSGTYFVIAQIDSLGDVTEFNEDNNLFITATPNVIIAANPTISLTTPDASATETAGNGGRFRVTRTGPAGGDLTVNYTVSGTANNGGPGSDFVFLSGAVTIPQGQLFADIFIDVVDDTRAEGPETAIVTLAAGPGYAVSGTQNSGTVTIADNEPVVTITATDATASENIADTARFTFTRAGAPLTAALTVNYSVAVASTATAVADFQTLTGTVTIPAGQASAVVIVTAVDDDDAEDSETLVLAITPDNAYSIGGSGQATATILDNEPIVTVRAGDATAREPAGATPDTATFIFTRTGPTTQPLTVFYSVPSGAGIATPGVDFTALTGEIIIPAGSLTATVTVTPLDDTLVEPAERVTLSVLADEFYRRGAESTRTASITIQDNEPTVSITRTDGAAGESGPGGGVDTGRITFTRTGPTAQALTVNYTVAGTATSGDDFVPLTGSIVIPIGQASAVLTLTPVQDGLGEGSETVDIALGLGAGYRINQTQNRASIVIADDEPVVSVVATDASAQETGTGETPNGGAFTFTRTGATTNALTVNYSVSGTAQSTVDYAALGAVTIPAGQRSVVVPLTVLNDAIAENAETVIVSVVNGLAYAAASGAAAQATVTIRDNESTVSVTPADASADEAGGTGAFRVTRTGGSNADPLTVNYTVTGSATAGIDYTTLAGSVVIPAGQASALVTVSPSQDPLGEAPETVILTLAANPAYVLGASPTRTATVTIADDEPVITVSVPDALAIEGSTTNTTIRFTFTRSGPTTNALTIPLNPGGTAGDGEDYATLPASVTILAGQRSVNLDVTVLQDLAGEPEETVVIQPDGNDGFRYTAPTTLPTARILDDEPVVTVRASDASGAEGGDVIRFTFTRTGPTTNALTLAPVDASESSSLPADFVENVISLISAVTIPAGQASVTITLTPATDAIAEAEETLILGLNAGPGYLVGSTAATATGRIRQNGPVASLTVIDSIFNETGDVTSSFRVSRTGATTDALIVGLILSGGAAIDGSDYTITAPGGVGGSGSDRTVTIPAGATSVTVTLTGQADSLGEGAETVVVELNESVGYAPGTQNTLTVRLGDSAPTVSVRRLSDGSETPGNPVRFVISRFGSTSGALPVNFSLGGTAMPWSDFIAPGPNATIPDGQREVTVTIEVIEDAVGGESNETIIITLDAGSGYQLNPTASARTATATIRNADRPNLAITPSAQMPSTLSVSTPGASFSFSADVENLGAGAAGAFNVQVFVSLDGTIDDADFLVGTFNFTGLSPVGSTINQLFTINLDTAAQLPTPGSYQVLVRIDGGRRVNEISETDNDALVPGLDLTITA